MSDLVDQLGVGGIDVQDHPNGRCTFVPVLRSWKDLDFEGVVDKDNWETGLEWLGRQDYDTITGIMHPAVYEAWRTGAMPDSVLVTRHYSEGFGWNMRPATLKSFEGRLPGGRSMTGWKSMAAKAQVRRQEEPLWWNTRCDLDKTKAIIGRELRFETGRFWKSTWSGSVQLKDTVGYNGVKEWNCDIGVAKRIAEWKKELEGAEEWGPEWGHEWDYDKEDWVVGEGPMCSREIAHGKYHTTLIHEMMHSFSCGFSPAAYSESMPWEEGVVEAMTRIVRPAVMGPKGFNIQIPERVWRKLDIEQGYNKYIKGLEAVRDAQGVGRREFYTALLGTNPGRRSEEAFRWAPEKVESLRNLYESFGIREGFAMFERDVRPVSTELFWGMPTIDEGLG